MEQHLLSALDYVRSACAWHRAARHDKRVAAPTSAPRCRRSCVAAGAEPLFIPRECKIRAKTCSSHPVDAIEQNCTFSEHGTRRCQQHHRLLGSEKCYCLPRISWRRNRWLLALVLVVTLWGAPSHSLNVKFPDGSDRIVSGTITVPQGPFVLLSFSGGSLPPPLYPLS